MRHVKITISLFLLDGKSKLPETKLFNLTFITCDILEEGNWQISCALICCIKLFKSRYQRIFEFARSLFLNIE